jgi:hypothetical protein
MITANLVVKFSVEGSGALTISLKFDGHVIFSQKVNHDSDIVTVSHLFTNWPRSRQLDIDIQDKTHDMTVVDDQGNIVSDTVFKLHSVRLDDVELGEVFYQTSTYRHDYNGSREVVLETPSDISGFNGVISWPFRSPVRQWLYEHECTDVPGLTERVLSAWPQHKKNIIRRIKNTFGIDIRALAMIFYFPKYVMQLMQWRNQGGRISGIEPILSDYAGTEAGLASGGYFYQDIMVANHVMLSRPRRHVTFGANLTGYVGHVATFMPITVCDVRPLTEISHPNISFVQKDLGDPYFDPDGVRADSVSCLSCLHHVGLGRYGDPINPDGPFVALDNLAKMVEPGGLLYIGTVVGSESQVIFNRGRVFRVNEILGHLSNFDLVRFDYYQPVGNVIVQDLARDQFSTIPDRSYGIFVLQSK